jgi:hypothetical protein
VEITYNREAAKYIIKDYIKDWVEFRDDGLYIKDDCIDHDWTTQGVFQWSPACELPEHDALTAPVLPIPFSANQLAAFFLTASGAFVASYYGSFEDGPDEGMLLAMGVRANQPREALKAAFAAYRAAQEVVGQLDEALQARAAELAHQYEVANIEANKREAVMEHGISDAEYRERRERARASVAQLHIESDDLNRRANEEHAAWRRRMVHRLLDVGMDGTAATQAQAPVGGVSGGELDFSLLATRKQLIAAFGAFTGMDLSWFSNVTHAPALLNARKVAGQGGRGHIAEPLFCPFEVMQWLVDPNRRKGLPIQAATAWRMLKNHFPKVHAQYEVGDPNTD